MEITALAFYLFAIVSICSAVFVTLSRHPVHSVLWLILAFLSSAGLFILLGAEFLAMLLIIIYVGAVAVLFLFVVMMLNVDFAALKADIAKFLPIGLLMGIIILIELGLVFGNWEFAVNSSELRLAVTPSLQDAHNTEALGLLIYDDFIYLFQASGLILLVAMIGAIVLTMRHRKDIKRQNVMEQMSRDPLKTMELKDIKPGQGL